MKVNLPYVLKAKTAIHVFQALVVFIAWAITFAILISPGGTDGRSKWYFSLCFFTAPALIYLSMTPRFKRTERFVNAYAFAAIDVIFCIFWFSAFIAVAAFNASSQNRGASERKLPLTNCTTFANGSARKCTLSKVTVGFGVAIFISFILTGSISINRLMEYRKTGAFITSKPATDHKTIQADTDEAFSTNPHDEHYDDDGAYPDPGRDNDGHALLHSTDSDEGRHPGRRWDDSPEQPNFPSGAYDGHRPVRGDYDEYHGDDVGRRPGSIESRPEIAPDDYAYRGARS
ncbi:MAG: hypothetical protein M1840_008559 [Geoglossum simile]|nr:MAG: hypothetical protein M1840_008559 [Geoglossum simile]